MPHPKNPGDIYYRRPIPGIHRDGEVDAKKFDVRSRPRSDDGHFTMGRNGPVDARSLGARPQGLPEKPGSRNTRIAPAFTKSPREDARKAPAYSKSPREDTVGLAEKQRFPSPQHGSPSGPDSSQKGFSGDRPRRPRTSRNGEDGEPSRQPRDKNFAGGSSSKGSKRRARPVWNEEEKEYLEEKRISESERTVDFQPPNMTQATFSGVRPAVISGEEGMNEFLDEKLHLAKRYLQREFVQWQSKEQKSDVMTLVEALKGIDETGSSDPPHHALAEQQTQSLLQKLLGGQYEFTKHLLSKGALGDVSRYSGKNKTYFPEDEKSLLQKVQSLMPPDDPRKGGKNTQSAARA